MIWLAIGLMVVVAAAALIWPLLRTTDTPADRAAYDLTVFQDQLKDVERDVSRGVLTEDEAGAARLEIQRRILTAGRAPAETHSSDSPGRRTVTAGVLALVVPLLALGIYIDVGAPALTKSESLKTGGTDDGGVDNEAEITRMVEQLAAKVANNPKDAEAAAFLARTYRQLGRYADAAGVYRQLLALNPDAETYASYGEVLVAAAQGTVSAEAHNAFMQALKLERGEPRARFYLGFEQAQKGEPKNAIAIWRDLTASSPADAPWLAMVREQMGGVAQQAGIPPMTVDPKHPLDIIQVAASPAEPVASPQVNARTSNTLPATPEVSALQDRMPPDQLKMIEGMVGGLAARLETNPDDYNGWMMLGRSYTVLNNTAGAENAYRKAIALKPGDVEPKVQFMLFQLRSVDPDDAAPLPRPLSDTAADILKIDPAQPEALYVAGLGRAKAGDSAGAKALWTKAEAGMPANSPQRAEISRRLRALP
jgi:cytochrome c-type biogenesis protein CcmH